jgi:rhamnogalacturonyl hydrolase YesR
MGQLKRLFGTVSDARAVGWTRAVFSQPGEAKYSVQCRHHGSVTVFIAGREVCCGRNSGKISATVTAPFGTHDVTVECVCKGSDWGFELTIADGKQDLMLVSPCNLAGSEEKWIYTGPIPESVKFDAQHLADLHRLVPLQHNHTYWRVDAPDAWVRAYNENPLYGRWNYPLGVTLYGLLHAAKAIGSTEAQQYVVNHVQLCCDTFRYALWDREQFGGATNVHHLLASIDSLDDCGSFGSCLLEVARHHELRGFREIADYVADYILHKQDRLADGSFYRKQMMHVFHENTMWADDLYMSVPFLCRYFELTGDGECIHDAARQFLGFKQRLFIPELKVMSHVFDLRRHLSTGIPWGRANGWTLFSLSELLAVLPADQPQRPEVLQMFRELAEGYLALQDENGMWHQVLTHPDSYPETSCTAMFIYGFARGVRYGWLEHPEPYANAALKAWGALNRTAIDRWGNVFGVCRGSEFSFTPEYYKKELLWNLNDTHGVGIVLLAGVEILRLAEHLRTNLKSKPR